MMSFIFGGVFGGNSQVSRRQLNLIFKFRIHAAKAHLLMHPLIIDIEFTNYSGALVALCVDGGGGGRVV